MALVEHQYRHDASVGTQLQVELMQRHVRVLVEPVHRVAMASGSSAGPVGRPSISLNTEVLDVVRTDVERGGVDGLRVGVLDTGDLLSPGPMADFVGGVARTRAADDLDGHGTAIAGIIRHLSPQADVAAVRVVEPEDHTSYSLLCGLTYALWSGRFDVLNISLSTQLSGGCLTVLGGSMAMVLDICQSNGAPTPQIVAAAGNTTTGHAFGYPAKLPGALAVLAWNAAGEPAPYNVHVDARYRTTYATGGDEDQSMATITYSNGKSAPLFGTSFAAAVVTAALLR